MNPKVSSEALIVCLFRIRSVTILERQPSAAIPMHSNSNHAVYIPHVQLYHQHSHDGFGRTLSKPVRAVTTLAFASDHEIHCTTQSAPQH